MTIVRAGEIMASHPQHARMPHDREYAVGAAYIVDRFCPVTEAAVPITDCGFMHADAVYDVVSVSRGSFFRLERHQARFARACEAIRVRNPFDREQEALILHELVARSGLRDAYVWWTVTRGRAPMGPVGGSATPSNPEPHRAAEPCAALCRSMQLLAGQET